MVLIFSDTFSMSVRKSLSAVNAQLGQIIDDSANSTVESSSVEIFRRLNDWSKKPGNFVKFAAEKKLIGNITSVLDSISAKGPGLSNVATSVQLLIGCLANLAIDSKCRSKVLDGNKVSHCHSV